MAMRSIPELDMIIGNDETLREAESILHDAVFGPDDWEWNARERTFRLIAWRELREAMSSRRVLPFVYVWAIPHRKCILELTPSDYCEVNGPTRMDNYTVVEFTRKEALIVLRAEPRLTVSLGMKGISGRLFDAGEITERQFHKTTLSWKPVRPKPSTREMH